MRDEVRPASSCVANVVYPVVAPDGQRPELQLLQRLPAAPGLRRGRRLPPGSRRRVAQLRRQRPVRPGARDRRHVDVLAVRTRSARACSASRWRRCTGVQPQLAARRQASAAAAQRAVRDPGGDHRLLGTPTGRSAAAGCRANRQRAGCTRCRALQTATSMARRQAWPPEHSPSITGTDTSKLDQSAPPGREQTMKRAIKNHAGDFAAILGLLVLSVVVAGYILTTSACASRSSTRRRSP